MDKRKQMRPYRVLFANDSAKSQNIIRLLRRNDIIFGLARVEPGDEEFPPDELPTLISAEGQWTGPEEVESYIRNVIRERDNSHSD